MTTTTTLTRWQALRHRQQSLPTHSCYQLRVLLMVALVVALYSFLLLGFQPDRSFPAVVRENERNRIDYERRWKDQVEANRKRQLKRKEQQRRREQQDDHSSENPMNSSSTIQQKHQQQTNGRDGLLVSTDAGKIQQENNNNTTSSTPQKQETESILEMFLHFVLSFFLSLTCFSLLMSLSRMATAAALLRMNPQQQQQQQRLRQFQSVRRRAMNAQTWVTRLNQQRQMYGERPISMESLQLVLQERDFDGNDYDNLWAFHEEEGSSAARIRGATQAEIHQFPHRTLGLDDDLLTATSSSTATTTHHNGNATPCPICLEPYRRDDTVRTIPCFHTFHTKCIDPWLEQKATCPICKHSALP